MTDDHAPDERPPSKSQLKREAHALQQLGAALVEAPERDWLALQLPASLIEALRQAAKITSHSARKRQLQLIGKLMRAIDPQPIQQYFDNLNQVSRQQVRAQHEAEHWRERMISEGDSAIEAWLSEHPAGDRQHLRQLVRQASKEQATDKPPRSSRSLFRYLRETAGQ